MNERTANGRLLFLGYAGQSKDSKRSSCCCCIIALHVYVYVSISGGDALTHARAFSADTRERMAPTSSMCITVSEPTTIGVALRMKFALRKLELINYAILNSQNFFKANFKLSPNIFSECL